MQKPTRQQDPHRLRLRRRPVDRARATAARPNGSPAAPASRPTRTSRPTASSVAFTGQYDGNDDVFVVPADGRRAQAADLPPRPRPGRRLDARRQARPVPLVAQVLRPLHPAVHHRPRRRRCPRRCRCRIADHGCYSPDGKKIAYVPFYNGSRSTGANVAWKRYRGGRQPVDLDRRSERLRPSRSCPARTPTTPARCGSRTPVYFLSDRDGPVTLYVYDPPAKTVDEADRQQGACDIKYASAGPDAHRLREARRAIPVRPEDAEVDAGPDHHQGRAARGCARATSRSATRSPTTACRRAGRGRSSRRAATSSPCRPAKGEVRNLTQHPRRVHDRDPSWSPDGKSIAYSQRRVRRVRARTCAPRTARARSKKIKPGDGPSFYYQPDLVARQQEASPTPTSASTCGSPTSRPARAIKVDTNPYQRRPHRHASRGRPTRSGWPTPRQLKSHLSAVFVYSLEKAKTQRSSPTAWPTPARGASTRAASTCTSPPAPTSARPRLADVHHRPHQHASVYLVVLSGGRRLAAGARRATRRRARRPSRTGRRRDEAGRWGQEGAGHGQGRPRRH